MLGLILIYWIGKYYYELADEYGKSKWGYAIIGVIAYYSGTAIAGVLIALIAPSLIDNSSTIAISLLALPLGLLTTYGLYAFFKKSFKKNSVNTIDELDEIGKNN